MELPTTWFSEVPGTLTESEVRLFALLMVYHHLTVDDAVLDGWVQRVLASAESTTPPPDVQLLSNAVKHRRLHGASSALLRVTHTARHALACARHRRASRASSPFPSPPRTTGTRAQRRRSLAQSIARAVWRWRWR